MRRGEIYYIRRRDTIGAEIMKARPAVIVSSDSINRSNGGVVEVVYLTTKAKKELPTHVVIQATGVSSTALCEQIDHVSTILVGDKCGTCTKEEMEAIDTGLTISLGLELKPLARVVTEEDVRLMQELERVRNERDAYAKLLERTLLKAGATGR